ncbi:VOC family protein [Ureibacillus sp. 179-F W5.1 NHS]|uniref:VOC family protein n=1 Tax=Lysinibacillus halotolerans TaxID=1368476 RepID=A0A3M8HCH9_9BACI|nr:VOC family protein [Lysinibacillus halotolerans]RND00073.1 VOC family protein [Lysinibacillus halotolerans]
MTKLTPFLMFQGQAEEAIHLYITVFQDTNIVSLTKYGEEQPSHKGKIANAVISIHGQTFYCHDSVITHEFTFTPSFSMFVECDSEQELEEAFAKLSKNGQVLMPLDGYGFSKKFGWVQDPFGISWQLNLNE